MSGIRLTGLASGLDTDGIITQLMSVEATGRSRIQLRQAAAQARQDGIKDVQSKVNAVKSAAEALRSVATWTPSQAASSSSTSTVAVRTTGAAGPGGYAVNVTKMASADQHTYGTGAWTPPATATTYTINNADSSPRTTVDVAAGASLDDVVTAFNAKTDSGVIAVNAGGKLVLAARETGAAKQFSVTGLTEDATLAQPGQDAEFSIGSATFKRPTNVVGDALAGLELTLKGTGTSFVTVDTPALDDAAVAKQVQSFVDAYNTLLESTRAKVTEKKVPDATTTTQAKRGALFGDNGLQEMLGALRGSIGSDLAALGISTGAASGETKFSADAVAGKLTFDKVAFQAQLDKDPVGVQRTLGGLDGTPGFAQAFTAVLDPYAHADGVLDGRVSTGEKSLKDIDDQLTRFDDRMATKEKQYRKQFSALEAAMAKSQALQAQMSAQISRLL
jgi:flagellar hook-associated protein 2